MTLKKILYCLYTVIFAIAIFSCKKTDVTQPDKPESQQTEEFIPIVFSCSNQSAGKRTSVSEDGLTVIWSTGDAFKAFSPEYKGARFDISSEPGGVYADFTEAADECFPRPLDREADAFDIIYPRAAVGSHGIKYITDGGSSRKKQDGVITAKFSDVQVYAGNAFATNTLLAAAYGKPGDPLVLTPVCGVLKLLIKAPNTVQKTYIKQITISDKNTDFGLSGSGEIDARSDNPILVITGANVGDMAKKSNKVTLQINPAIELSRSEHMAFWIVLPPNALADGCKIVITNTLNQTYEIETDPSMMDLTIERGAVKTLGKRDPISFADCCGGAVPSVEQSVTYQGYSYQTIKIDGRIWLAENLHATKYADGTPILEAPKSGSSYILNPIADALSSYYMVGCLDKSCYTSAAYPENLVPEIIEHMGNYYSWAAAMRLTSTEIEAINSCTSISAKVKYINNNLSVQRQGICPNGWHIPTISEYQSLADYISPSASVQQINIELKGTSGWTSTSYGITGNGNGYDCYGFTVLPSGDYRVSDDKSDTDQTAAINNIGLHSHIWTATAANYNSKALYAYSAVFGYQKNIVINPTYKGMTVRCVKN